MSDSACTRPRREFSRSAPPRSRFHQAWLWREQHAAVAVARTGGLLRRGAEDALLARGVRTAAEVRG
eukprot:4901957-Pleurochrysis_carterae.AAC.4